MTRTHWPFRCRPRASPLRRSTAHRGMKPSWVSMLSWSITAQCSTSFAVGISADVTLLPGCRLARRARMFEPSPGGDLPPRHERPHPASSPGRAVSHRCPRRRRVARSPMTDLEIGFSAPHSVRTGTSSWPRWRRSGSWRSSPATSPGPGRCSAFLPFVASRAGRCPISLSPPPGRRPRGPSALRRQLRPHRRRHQPAH